MNLSSCGKRQTHEGCWTILVSLTENSKNLEHRRGIQMRPSGPIVYPILKFLKFL
jgi:hypothetical protein